MNRNGLDSTDVSSSLLMIIPLFSSTYCNVLFIHLNFITSMDKAGAKSAENTKMGLASGWFPNTGIV
jgi:hypothetical protein